MNLFRLLLVGAAIYLVWRMLNPPRRRDSAHQRAANTAPDYERMARCAQCGTHLPLTTLSPSGRCGRCSG